MTTRPPEPRRSEPVTVWTCKDLAEAEIVRSMLEAGGINAFIPDENFASLGPWQALGTGGVRVQVPADAAERALELLEREEAGE